MAQVQLNSTSNSNAGYTVSSSSLSPHAPQTPNRNYPSLARRQASRYRPASVNSLASNYSSLSSLSTVVHPSSIYENREGLDGRVSRYYYSLNVDQFDDADTSIPDAYDEDRYEDPSYNYAVDEPYDDSGDAPYLYHDTSTIEEALPFYVLAVYDFTEGDPDNMLLFRKGDLLEIISVQPSGWWAAQPFSDEAGPEKQSGENQDRVGWIPSAFVNVIPTHLLDLLKDTPRENRISIYGRGELVESPEDIDSLLQSWGLDFDNLDRDGERGAEPENEVTESVIQEAVDTILQHESLISLQAPTHAPAGPRRRPLPSMPTSATNGRSNTPPQLSTVLTDVKPSTSSAQTTTTPSAAAAAFISPVQPSPITPIPPNVPAPAPFSVGRRPSVASTVASTIRQRDRDRDLPPSLPPPDTPLPPLPALPEVAEVEIEVPVPDYPQQNKLSPSSGPYKHQRSASASTIGTSSALSTASHNHDIRTIAPLPTPPATAKSGGIGTAAEYTLSLAGTTPASAFTASTHSNPSLSAPSTSLRFAITDKPMPPTPPRALSEANTAIPRERSNSNSASIRSVSPPNSAISASGDDGHPPTLVPGNVDASGAHPHTHAHTASMSSTATHSRSSSSISSLSFLPRNRSANGSGSGGSHNVISSTISSSLSSLRRKAAKYGPGGGGGGSSSSLSGLSTAAASETINITSSPKNIPQKLLSDGTGSGASTPGVDEEDFDDDDSVIAATRRERGRVSPAAAAAAVAPVQAGDKEKVRKLLGDDAVNFLNAAGTSGGAPTSVNGAPGLKGPGGSSSNGSGKANAGAFARRRREIKRQSQESDSSFGVNGRRTSESSIPGTSIRSSLSTPLSPSVNLPSGGPVSHLDLGFSQDDIDVEVENGTDAELDDDVDGQLQAFKSFTPLSDEPRTPGARSRSPRTPRTANSLPGVKNNKIGRLLGDDDAQAFHNAKQALAAQPWYLKPERDVESGEIKLEHDGSVKYGSVEALVERLTVPFYKSDLERRFRHVFLLTFHSFTNADRVLDLLIEKYEMAEPRGLSDEEFDEWRDKKLRPTRARVLHVFTLWVDNYGLIQDDSRLIARLQSFLELVQEPPQNAQIARNILQNIANKRWTDINLPALESVAATRRPVNKLFKAKTDILQSDHGEVARQLTLYEARLYLKIRPHECFKFAANQKAEGIANLRTFISTNDKIASWVKMSVLANDPLGKRADVIQFWIRVAERCRTMNNFSSTAAIVAALTSQVIARLQLTWAHVSRTSRIEPLVKIFETTNNFATYRNTLTTVDSACVPYIGIFLSDMVKISEGFPDPPKLTIPPTGSTSNSAPSTSTQGAREVKLINFAKYSKMEDVAQMVLKFQPKVRDNYKWVEVVPIMQYVESQLALAATKDENEFWTRSQALQRSELAHVDIRKGLELAGF